MKNLNNKGYLLPMAVIFTIIVVILGAGILYLGGMEQIGAKRRLNREKAFYIAEAGAYRAYAYLKEDINWEPETEPIAFGDGTFNLDSLDRTDETIVITSTGTYHNVQEKVKLTLTTTETGGGVFSTGIFGASKVYLGGSSKIYGYDSRTGETKDADVGSNTSVYIESSGIIYGNASVSTSGGIHIPSWQNPSVAITGTRKEDAEPRTLPAVEIPPELRNLSYTQEGDSKIYGNVSPPAPPGKYKIDSNHNFTMTKWPRDITMTTGSYRFNNFTIDSDAQVTFSGNLKIYIEGTLSVTGNSNIKFSALGSGTKVEIYIGTNGSMTVENSGKINYNNSPSNLGIYVASSNAVNILGDARVNSAIYAPNSVCTIKNSSELRGGVVANQVQLPGDAIIYDDVALREVGPPGDPGGGGTGEITIIHWTKPDWEGAL